MEITFPPQLEEALRKAAQDRGVTPEALALESLQNLFIGFSTEHAAKSVDTATWRAKLREAASDCGVSLSNEALSREEIYD